MIISIFEYSHYKSYLNDKLDSLSKKERGWKQKTAAHIGCQSSYLSQILSGKPDITLDQAHRLNFLFHHDKIESRYFILLVEIARSSTKELKDFLKEQIQELKKSQFDLKKRLKETEQISEEAMNKYYSTWFYSAIHIALAIPELQDTQAISKKFNLPESLVSQIIGFLENNGLIEKKDGEYTFTKMRIHLDRNSDFIQRHHINWRSQSLQSVEKNFPEDLHYSTVFAISKTDFNSIKELLIQSIESARKVIKESASEEVCAITLDFFKV